MEVGAVKQAFNNEVILLKKKLNQARIQIIHKLTRKAKTFAEKKAPEPLKEKLKRKAESAVNEVLILKKIKPKDLAKFIVTHTGELKDYLNKPQVDHDKASARLLLHKSLQDKYKFIRGKFANIPIKDLFMSRQERRKLKKEAKDNNKKKKDNNKNNKKENGKEVVHSEGNWEVEEVDMTNDSKEFDENVSLSNKISASCDEDISAGESESENEIVDNNEENVSPNSDDSDTNTHVNNKVTKKNKSTKNNMVKIDEDDNADVDYDDEDGDDDDDEDGDDDDDHDDKDTEDDEDKTEKVKHIPDEINMNIHKNNEKFNAKNQKVNLIVTTNKTIAKKAKDRNKNKNFDEKILLRKFKKDTDDLHISETKVIDPFFITASGENYLSVAEPRQPDEIKEIHKQGNRKIRRAAMFGHVPKIKPRQDNVSWNNNSYNSHNEMDRKTSFNNKYNSNRSNKDDSRTSKFEDRKSNYNDNKKSKFNDDSKPPYNARKSYNDKNDDKPEKLHPSWEAKKRQSGILPFQGKKIVFDDR
ncbi:uncharacterized protein ACR2FA_004256 [Aphomia sociella]